MILFSEQFAQFSGLQKYN